MTGETIESMMVAVRIIAPALMGRDPSDIHGARAAMDGPFMETSRQRLPL
jgi:hypothetical protein